LERTESRGGHTRSDYPDSDEKQAREQIVIKKEGNRMAVRREQQPPIPPEFMALIKESVRPCSASFEERVMAVGFTTTRLRRLKGWSCLMPCTPTRRSRRPLSRCGGTASQGSRA